MARRVILLVDDGASREQGLGSLEVSEANGNAERRATIYWVMPVDGCPRLQNRADLLRLTMARGPEEGIPQLCRLFRWHR